MNALFSRMAAALLIICATAALPACKDPKPASAAVTQAEQNEFKIYQKDGLEVSYPNNWELAYDSAPSIFTERGVGFNASEFSTAVVYVTDAAGVDPKEFVELFKDQLNLPNGDYIKDLTESELKVGQFEGTQFTWVDTMICCADVNFSVFKVQDKPVSVFAVFTFIDDLTQQIKHREKFLNSIQLN